MKGTDPKSALSAACVQHNITLYYTTTMVAWLRIMGSNPGCGISGKHLNQLSAKNTGCHVYKFSFSG